MGEPWFNTQVYSPLELALFGIGALFWVAIYVVVILQINRGHYVEIPAAAVCANVAWEFLWGLIFQTNMGLLYVWGYRLWFFMDVYIVYATFRYGMKQVDNPSLRRYFAPAFAFGILAWTVTLYFFIPEYDDAVGAFSGYILTVMMSALYIVQLVRQPAELSSPWIAWFKLLGNGLISIFCVLHFSDHGTLLTLCAIAFVLDVAYIVILRAIRAPNAVVAPLPKANQIL